MDTHVAPHPRDAAPRLETTSAATFLGRIELAIGRGGQRGLQLTRFYRIRDILRPRVMFDATSLALFVRMRFWMRFL